MPDGKVIRIHQVCPKLFDKSLLVRVAVSSGVAVSVMSSFNDLGHDPKRQKTISETSTAIGLEPRVDPATQQPSREIDQRMGTN